MTGRAKPGTARRALDDATTEAQWESEVLGLADAGQWLAFHAKPATVYRRGRPVRITHQDGDAGFPDWCFVRDRVVVFAELKTETNSLSDAQKAWAAHLGDLAVVWRPRDRQLVRATLLAPRGDQRVDVVPPRLRPRQPRVLRSTTTRATGFDGPAGTS